MDFGTTFVVEATSDEGEELLDELLKRRIYNYTIVKKMLFGYFISSLDGAIKIPVDSLHGFVIRRPTEDEVKEVVKLLNYPGNPPFGY